MTEFEFWQKWGLQLNEKQFANAFLALGFIAQSNKSRHPYSLGNNLDEIFKKVAELSKVTELIVPWHFPRRQQKVKIGNELVLLSDLNSEEITKVWESVTNNHNPSYRIQILSYPKVEKIEPWLQLLVYTYPSLRAAHIGLGLNQRQPKLHWPLRLGYFPGNAGEKIIRGANFYWPSNELTRIVSIDRENANCDVLFYSGNIDQILRTLLETPIHEKANLIIMRATSEDDINLRYQRLISILEECYASGIIVINASVTENDLEYAINRFIENLSHNQPFDVAIFESFTKSYKINPAIFLNRKLALFQIQELIGKLQNKLKNLPQTARPEIELHSFRKMGIPVKDKEMNDLCIPGNAADILEQYKKKIVFENESTGASGMVELNKAIERSESITVNEKSLLRYLRKQILINKNGKLVKIQRAFLRGIPTLIQISIGPPDKEWDTLGISFPSEKLPKNIDHWYLTVVLAEPNHLIKGPIKATIKLPKVGCSEVCEFRVELKENKPFEGRIIVLHRGRVLQTAILKGRVVSKESEIQNDDNISFIDLLHVRSNISDLEGRYQFDLAFVLNHTTNGIPRLTAISDKNAWLSDLSESETIIKKINEKLTKVADWEKDYRGGLENEENVKLLIDLARIGHELYGSIVLTQIKDRANQAIFEKLEYIQIVSTKIDALAPLEFIYTAPTPAPDATLCTRLETILKEKDTDIRRNMIDVLIKGTCQRVDKGEVQCEFRTKDHICPMSFWGLSKVIERHMVTPALKSKGFDFFLQSEKTSSREKLDISGIAIIAASQKVKPDMRSLVSSVCANRLGSKPIEVTDWDDWVQKIEENNPHVLLALPHTDGNGVNTTLEINGKTLSSGDVTLGHVHKKGENNYPLVALLGCDTAGTAIDYGEHIKWFRIYEAAIVISTIAKVFGDHAALVAEQLINGLTREKNRPQCLGEIIREIKRDTLLEGSLMAWCVVAFGDADWKIN